MNAQDDCGLAVQACIAAFNGGSKLDIRHLAQLNRFAIFKRHRQALQVFDSCSAANVSNQVFARIKL